MISLNSVSPPPAPAELKGFFDLLALLANPAATKKRVDEFAGAAAELTALMAEVKAAQADLAADRASHEAAVQAARAEAEKAFAEQESALQSKIRDADRIEAERQAAFEKRAAELGKAEAAVIERGKDVARRMSLLREAAA
jgi:hypothetical protein